MKKRILITGASGFLGQSFINLYSDKYEFITFSLLKDKIKNINFTGIDIVIHFAALVHQEKEKSYEEYQKVNVFYTLDIAIAAKKSGVKHFLFLSTISVFGSKNNYINSDSKCLPETNYGKSKFEAENKLKLIEDESFIISIVRPPMIYGKNAPGNIAKTVKLVRFFRLLPFGGIDNNKTFVFLENLLFCIDQIILTSKKGFFLVSDNESISTSELIDMISISLNKKNINFKIPFFELILKTISPNLHIKLYGSLVIDNSDTLDKLCCKLPFTVGQGITNMLK